MVSSTTVVIAASLRLGARGDRQVMTRRFGRRHREEKMAVPAGERREAVTGIELGGEAVLCSRQVYPDDLSHPCFATPAEEMREGGILDAAIEDAAGEQKDRNRQPRLDARPEQDADDAARA